MKPRMRCTLLGWEGAGNFLIAVIVRRQNHPRLGTPSGGVTTTSVVKRVDFTKGEIETTNSIYVFQPMDTDG